MARKRFKTVLLVLGALLLLAISLTYWNYRYWFRFGFSTSVCYIDCFEIMKNLDEAYENADFVFEAEIEGQSTEMTYGQSYVSKVNPRTNRLYQHMQWLPQKRYYLTVRPTKLYRSTKNVLPTKLLLTDTCEPFYQNWLTPGQRNLFMLSVSAISGQYEAGPCRRNFEVDDPRIVKLLEDKKPIPLR